MTTLVFSLALLTVALALSGCATLGAPFAPGHQGPTDRADVYVYRTSAMGAPIAPTVHANKVPLLGLPPSGYFVYRALPGELTLEQHNEATTSVTFDVKAGETYYVKGSVGTGFLFGHPHLVIVAKEDGEREVRECKLISGVVPTVDVVEAGPALAKK